MHDLVHDLARSTMVDELVDFNAQERNTHGKKYCRYALLSYDQTMKLASILPSKIRALHFSDSGQLDVTSGAFSLENCLRALSFCECSGILFPFSIGHLRQLRCLVAPRMQNESLPECITELGKLQYLNINGSSQISALPESFGKLGCLRYICLSGCSGISKLPKSFGDLKSMVHLDMSGCSGIKELPESIGDLKCMVHLNLSGCSLLREFPSSLCNLTDLQHLVLSGCSGISKLPESFGDLKCMVHLNLSGCSLLRELPSTLCTLTDLQHLELSGCSGISKLPESFGDLKSIVHLDMSGCYEITALPETLCGLTQLQFLNMSSCKKIISLPKSLMQLQNLLHLDLSDCSSINDLGGVHDLTALQDLDMSRSREIGPQVLPGVLANLTNLKYLGLSSLIIDGTEESACYVPDCIGGMTNLEHLVLAENTGLACLPESIGNLKRLHTLDLNGCFKLKSLPKSIGNLKRLHTLNLTFCPHLESLPESILGLNSLTLSGCSDKLLDQVSSLVNYGPTFPVLKVRADRVNGCSNLHLLEGNHASKLQIHCLENMMSLEEATKVKLSDKHNLSGLTLAWSTEREDKIFEDKDLLGQLVPPIGLRSMRLEGYSSTSFPGWLMCIYRHLANLVSIQLCDMPMCSDLPSLGQLPHLEKLLLSGLPGIKIIDLEFCGGKGAFRQLSSFTMSRMEGLEEWSTTYFVEDGVEEFMFPALDSLVILDCPKLRLKPCVPTFRECTIFNSDQVIYSWEVDKTSHGPSSTSSRAIKLNLTITGDSCQSIRIFHHFPTLHELRIFGPQLTSLPESIRHLTSLESLTLEYCKGIVALPEWLGDLSSLKRLVISACSGIMSLPACIQQLTKLQTLEVRFCYELKKWCESEENKTKLAHISNVRIPDI